MSLNGIPALYDHKNLYNASFSPSTVHASNTGLSLYFQRYLLQKVFSVYEFDLPEDWDRSFFQYVMFCLGFGAVINTDKFGIIFQNAQLYGYNIYYRPTKAIITNPLLNGSRNLLIGEECEIIKLTPDYKGIYDTVLLYADMMAVLMESFGVNALNAKFSYVFAADNKAMAESMKKLYDQVASGQPSVVVDKNLFNEDNNPRWVLFDQNLKNNFIGKDIMECLDIIDNMFNTAMGINNANTDKRERLNTLEVTVNNQSTQALTDVILESMQESFEKVNNMFDLNLSVRKRYTMEGGLSDDDADTGRTDEL